MDKLKININLLKKDVKTYKELDDWLWATMIFIGFMSWYIFQQK